MVGGTSPLTRCGIDTIEIARVARLLLGTPDLRGSAAEDLLPGPRRLSHASARPCRACPA